MQYEACMSLPGSRELEREKLLLAEALNWAVAVKYPDRKSPRQLYLEDCHLTARVVCPV